MIVVDDGKGFFALFGVIFAIARIYTVATDVEMEL